jgi:ABC-2 type transport system ATP-binding protein
MSTAAQEAPKNAPDYAIDIRGLRKVYAAQGGEPEKEALKGVDLAIPRGSVFGLLGPNGAGKSTLINILAGLVNKTSGSVRIWGFDQDANPRMSRASIGVVPQELHLDPFFTPREAMEIQAGLYGVKPGDRRTDALLTALGLGDKMNVGARSLSGGMKRRLLIGKALAHSPPVLILDEPTAGVDIDLRRQLWDYVRKLNEDGVTIILTTHYLEEAEEMCDRIAIINHGEVVANEPKTALLGRLDRKTVTIVPVTALDTVPDTLAGHDGIETATTADGALAITYSRQEASLGALLELVHSAGIEIRDVTTSEAGLEGVFLDLVAHDD